MRKNIRKRMRKKIIKRMRKKQRRGSLTSALSTLGLAPALPRARFSSSSSRIRSFRPVISSFRSCRGRRSGVEEWKDQHDEENDQMDQI